MKLVVLTQGAVNTAALQRLNGTMFFSEPEAIETLAACADCGLPEDDPEYRDAMRHVVSDHEHLDDDAKLAEWYDKVVDNEICYHLDDELSDTHFVVCDAFDNIALCYALELVHEAICDGKEM